ncbi:MAG: TraR/DksA family transcriptional regulator [Pseudomonadota bacterium]
MAPELLAVYRGRLLQLKQELADADALGQQGQAIVALDQQSVGRLARMDALQNQAMAQAGGRRRNVMAQRIGAALLRIDVGTFGECVECGEDIALKRLDLDPTTPCCISCASG